MMRSELHDRARIRAMRWLAFAVVALACASSLASLLAAQRPVAPGGWSIDTLAVRPVATRKGGMLSSDAHAEVLGPLSWTGSAAADWLGTYARDDAGARGKLIPPTGNPVSVVTISGTRVIVAAYSVNVANGTLYLSYTMPAATEPGTPAVVIRSTFNDAVTMVRAFRSSVEALLPYVVAPTAQMRALAVAAAPAPVPTSFRTPPPPDAPRATAPDVATASADSSVASAVQTGMTDAIALLGADSANSKAQPSPARQPTTRPSATLPASRAGAISEANLDVVVFYQWGDLQYHPVALFKDGTTFDLDDEAIDALDAARSLAEHPGSWGRWRRSGDKYFLTDSRTGRVSDWTMGSGFHAAFPAPTAGTLTGRYKAVSGSTMGETSTLLTSSLRFLPDGRFTSGTDFASVGSGEVSGVTMAGGSSRSTSGSYRLSRYHIELKYDSGQTKLYFFAFGSSGSPAVLDRDMIFIGDTAYVTDTP